MPKRRPEEELITQYHSTLGYSTWWVYNLAMRQPGNFQLCNRLWVASLGYKMQPEPNSLPQKSPLSSSSMAHWVPTYSEKGSSALKGLEGPGSGMIRCRAGGIVQGPLGDLTITGSLRIPDLDTTNRSLNPDLWIRIL